MFENEQSRIQITMEHIVTIERSKRGVWKLYWINNSRLYEHSIENIVAVEQQTRGIWILDLNIRLPD